MASNWRIPQAPVYYGCRQSDGCVTPGGSRFLEQYSSDVIVLRGGINGAGVARDAQGDTRGDAQGDAQGRGASVLLLECGDLAPGDTLSDPGEVFGHGFSAKALELNSSALQTDRLAQYLEKKVICS